MTLHAEAIHDQGVLRLLGPTPLLPQQRVKVAIETADDSVEALLDWDEIEACRREVPSPPPTLEQVRAATASIPDAMAEVVAEARGERY